MGLHVERIPTFGDNYTYLIVCEETREAAIVDAPEFDIHFLEFPYEHAWPGAKGVGEIPMDGLSPAIANAFKQATGVRFTRIPIIPEDLFESIVVNGVA